MPLRCFRHAAALFSAFFLFLGPIFAQGAYNRLVLDRTGSAVFGAENIITISSWLHQAEDRVLVPDLLGRRNTLSKIGGAAYRFGKLFMLDWPVDYMFVLAQHEMYGHGARGREFGLKNFSYQLRFPPPYGPAGGSISPTPGQGTGPIWPSPYRAMWLAGGNEGNTVMANLLEYRFMQDDRMNYHDAMMHIMSRHNLSEYIWVEAYSAATAGPAADVMGWIFEVNRKYSQPGKEYTINRLLIHNFSSFLNPLQFAGAYAIFINYVGRGKEELPKIPTIPLLGRRYLPMVAYNLTPFGAEFIVDQYWIRHAHGLQVQARIGDPLLNTFWGAGLTFHHAVRSQWIALTPRLDIWNQPSMELGFDRPWRTTRGGLGIMGKLDVALFPFRRNPGVGLYLQLGYKTDGYIIDQALSRGLVLRGGLAFSHNSRSN